jgi:hypothetical protein
VRGDLHRDRARAGVAHRGQHGVEFERQRRRVLQRPRAVAEDAAERSDDAARQPRRFGNRAQQIARGRLAVRAGDAEHEHRPRGVVVERVGEPRDRDARVGDHDLRDAEVGRTLDDEHRRTARDGLGEEVVTVDALAAHRDEGAAGRHRARVDGKRSDLGGERTDDARRAECVEQRAKLSHYRFVFAAGCGRTKRGGAAGMTPSFSIASRASSAKIGAATVPP